MGIEFEAEKQAALQRMQAFQNPSGSSSSKLVNWLMKKGIVHSEQTGQAVLLGIVALNIIVTLIIIFYIL